MYYISCIILYYAGPLSCILGCNVLALPVIYHARFLTDYAKTYAFFLGTSTDVTSQMTVLHEQTDWPCATSTAEVQELQPSETQLSETLPVVARKQSKYWNYIESIHHSI